MGDRIKRTGRLLAGVVLCAALSACGRTAGHGASAASGEPLHAAACDALTLPASLTVPQTDGTLQTMLESDVLAGMFTTVNSCQTRGLRTADSITVRVQATLDDAAPPADAKLALWRLTENGAKYLETVSFACDGSAQSHTFSGLDPGAQYRLVFSYTESTARRMTGAFLIDGVRAEIADPLPEEGAVAVEGAPESAPPVESGE